LFSRNNYSAISPSSKASSIAVVNFFTFSASVNSDITGSEACLVSTASFVVVVVVVIVAVEVSTLGSVSDGAVVMVVVVVFSSAAGLSAAVSA